MTGSHHKAEVVINLSIAVCETVVMGSPTELFPAILAQRVRNEEGVIIIPVSRVSCLAAD